MVTDPYHYQFQHARAYIACLDMLELILKLENEFHGSKLKALPTPLPSYRCFEGRGVIWRRLSIGELRRHAVNRAKIALLSKYNGGGTVKYVILF